MTLKCLRGDKDTSSVIFLFQVSFPILLRLNILRIRSAAVSVIHETELNVFVTTQAC